MMELAGSVDFGDATSVKVFAMADDFEQLMESASPAHYRGTADYVLYTTESGIFPFVKYEQQLAEINDYCVLLLGALKEKVQAVAMELQGPLPEDDDFFQEYQDYRYGKLLSWQFLYEDINKCTMLLLLLSFLESTLNEIANWFSDIAGCALEWKKVRNPKVSNYIQQIGACCKTDLQSSLRHELEYYDKVRKIRNQFVHNEWDQLTDRFGQFALADVIGVISGILFQIEKAAVSSGLI